MSGAEVRAARESDSAEILRIVKAGFAARPALSPPAPALTETEESIAQAIASHGGLLALIDGVAVGSLLFEDPDPGTLGLRRVAVDPQAQGQGIAQTLVAQAEREAADQGRLRTQLIARMELPATLEFWRRQGYSETARNSPFLTLAKALPVTYDVNTAEATQQVARELASHLQPGDLLVLVGDLGAGKTTFTQGLAQGLGVRGAVTSPTFVIARVHPSLTDGPALVHVDAYRLGGIEELDDLDLDTSLEQAVTVVEWGAGLAEGLQDSRLVITLTRAAEAPGQDHDEPRRISLSGFGPRWASKPLPRLVNRASVY